MGSKLIAYSSGLMVCRSQEHESSVEGYKGSEIPLVRIQSAQRLVMGVSGAAQNAPLIGGQSAKRLCMVRCRWRGNSPKPVSDKTAIRFMVR